MSACFTCAPEWTLVQTGKMRTKDKVSSLMAWLLCSLPKAPIRQVPGVPALLLPAPTEGVPGSTLRSGNGEEICPALVVRTLPGRHVSRLTWLRQLFQSSTRHRSLTPPGLTYFVWYSLKTTAERLDVYDWTEAIRTSE